MLFYMSCEKTDGPLLRRADKNRIEIAFIERIKNI